MQAKRKDENENTAVVELNVEELEEVIAPGIRLQNHNETLLSDEIELCVEEVEEVIAPRIAFNHNETIISDDVELHLEELSAPF